MTQMHLLTGQKQIHIENRPVAAKGVEEGWSGRLELTDVSYYIQKRILKKKNQCIYIYITLL